jgi:hypothetical protein
MKEWVRLLRIGIDYYCLQWFAIGAKSCLNIGSRIYVQTCKKKNTKSI